MAIALPTLKTDFVIELYESAPNKKGAPFGRLFAWIAAGKCDAELDRVELR